MDFFVLAWWGMVVLFLFYFDVILISENNNSLVMHSIEKFKGIWVFTF